MKALKGLFPWPAAFATNDVWVLTPSAPNWQASLSPGQCFVPTVHCTVLDVDRFIFLSDLDSDAAVKQILLHMNAEQQFIIQDLDDTHLVIKGEELERIRRALDVEASFFLLARWILYLYI